MIDLGIDLGHHEYFKKMAEEEKEHANQFMTYQNKRGGTIVLLDIKVGLHVYIA
jgi:ferritin